MVIKHRLKSRAPVDLHDRTVFYAKAEGPEADDLSESHAGVVRPMLATGKKVRKAAAGGHEHVHGTPKEKAERWAGYQKKLDEAHAEHPRWGLTALREEVAERMPISFSTIKRHTRRTW